VYRFANFRLDARASILSDGDVTIGLPPKAVDLLHVLVENAGRVTTKAELMDRLWPDGFVEEGNLTQYVYLLRKTFRERGLEGVIETVPRRGYRFALPVDTTPEESRVALQRTETHRPSRRWYAGLAAALVMLFVSAAIVFSPHAAGEARLSGRDRQLYELGRYYWSLRTVPALHRSAKYFESLLRDRPQSAIAYAGLADVNLGLYDYACEDDPAECARDEMLAKRYARKAVSLDPVSAIAHTSLAMTLRIFDVNYIASDREFRLAIVLDPQYALAHEWYGNSLLVRRQIAAARRELQPAADLDPVAPAAYAWLARTEYYAHRCRAAVQNAKRYAEALVRLKHARLDNDTTRAFLALDPRLDPVRTDPRFRPWT
jgi:DNA-binding winged helix-turn-helix (wHTH) protein/Tfp pilus assembly protein PilF